MKRNRLSKKNRANLKKASANLPESKKASQDEIGGLTKLHHLVGNQSFEQIVQTRLKNGSIGPEQRRYSPTAGLRKEPSDDISDRQNLWGIKNSPSTANLWASDYKTSASDSLNIVNQHFGNNVLQRQAAKVKKAQKEFAKFIAKGPYKWPNFKISNPGEFDVLYQPSLNMLNINMKVKFVFPDDPPSILELLFGIGGAKRKALQKAYRKSIINSVTKAWSKRYAFQNKRSPQIVWGKLNPTNVKVSVQEVKAGQHFLIEARRKTKGRAQVHKSATKLYKGDETPQFEFNPGTRKGELKRVNRINPSPLLFANNSAAIAGAYSPKLKFLATYLKRINNPKFNIKIKGHSSSTGKKTHNKRLSKRRALAVEKALKGTGLNNHNLITTWVGETGATAHKKWAKVVITPEIPAGWKNKQAVDVHEFGHMFGLDDEYGPGKTSHYNLVKKAFGKAYADQVAKKGDTDYASIMEGGDDVRIQHYVTFWSALAETTLKKAPVPTPKLGYKDWKFIG